jgi:hypothetical protein
MLYGGLIDERAGREKEISIQTFAAYVNRQFPRTFLHQYVLIGSA